MSKKESGTDRGYTSLFPRSPSLDSLNEETHVYLLKQKVVDLKTRSLQSNEEEKFKLQDRIQLLERQLAELELKYEKLLSENEQEKDLVE